jgi:purine-binding chemotaxis protein CheW
MDFQTHDAHNEHDEQIDQQFNLQKVLWFTLGDEEYAIMVESVQTILDRARVTPVPNTPAFVYGIINNRGALIPIVELRKLFRMPDAEVSSSVLIILEYDAIRVGVLVDKVNEVLDIDFSILQPPPQSLTGPEAEYIKGIHKMQNTIVTIIDIVRVLNIAKDMIGRFA